MEFICRNLNTWIPVSLLDKSGSQTLNCVCVCVLYTYVYLIDKPKTPSGEARVHREKEHQDHMNLFCQITRFFSSAMKEDVGQI